LEENKQIGLENADEASSPSGIAGLLFVAGSGLRRSHKSVVVTGDHLVIARGMWLFFQFDYLVLSLYFFTFLFIVSPTVCVWGLRKNQKYFSVHPLCVCLILSKRNLVSLDKESF
jgi:hypothetical protein